MGGYKGSGLSLVIGLWPDLSNRAAFGREVRDFAAPAGGDGNVGQFVIALDVARFVPIDTFKAEIDRHIRDLVSSRPVPGGDDIRVPGWVGRRAGPSGSATVCRSMRRSWRRSTSFAKSLAIAPLGARA